MNPFTTNVLVGLALVGLLGTPSTESPSAAPIEVLSLDCETDLALSAAPEHLRAAAGLYVLESDGYRHARESQNGFTCIVNRDHPRVLKPTCFDEEGAATIVPTILYFGSALQAGVPLDEVREEVARRFGTGQLESPGRPGLAYMLSRYNRPYNPANDSLGWFPPHLMFYAPNLTNDDIGFQMEAWHENSSLPFIGYGGPQGYMIVITDDGMPRSTDDLRSCPAWVHAG